LPSEAHARLLEDTMSMDKRPEDKSTSNPSYQDAKPGALTADAWHLFDGAEGSAIRDAMNSHLADNWWAIALRGVFAILFGVIALLLPGVTLTALVLLFAAYMLVDGIFDIVAAVRAAKEGERWGWLLFEGIVDLVAGAIAVAWPLITVLAFVLLMAAWAIVSGVLLTVAAFRVHVSHGRWLMALSGVVSVVWGVLLGIWPLIGAVVLTWWIGAYALVFGVLLLILAFRLRGRRGHTHALPQGA
jgi:uncharacterized membrane protein HdeD (DUF308 family)